LTFQVTTRIGTNLAQIPSLRLRNGRHGVATAEAWRVAPEGSAQNAKLRLARMAGSRQGRITIAQLRALGVGETTIGDWKRAGYLHPRLPGVYAVGSPAHTVESDVGGDPRRRPRRDALAWDGRVVAWPDRFPGPADAGFDAAAQALAAGNRDPRSSH
jgi:hypothetical protein